MSISYGGDYITDTDGGKLRPSSSVMRNRIINGAMVIDQRNAGASVTGNDGSYGVDRWIFATTQSGKMTSQQNAGSVTPPVGFNNYLGITSSSAYSVGSTDFFNLRQKIEGYNAVDLGWGTANAKTVTLSFWVYSSLTGTFGGAVTNSAFDQCYPFSYTISSANTWEQKSITITGATSGTWNKTNGVSIQLCFGLGAGATYSGTAGAWSSNPYVSATGATSVVGTSGATFYITGVQLEVGSSATGFEYRQYQQELALCQRYYYKTPTITYINTVTGNYNSSYVSWKASMRASPTVTTYSNVTDTSGKIRYQDLATDVNSGLGSPSTDGTIVFVNNVSTQVGSYMSFYLTASSEL